MQATAATGSSSGAALVVRSCVRRQSVLIIYFLAFGEE